MRESAPQIIWKNRQDGGNSEFNPLWYKLTGQTLEQSLNYGWLSAIHPEDRARLKAQRDEGIRQQQAYAVEFRLKMASGEYRWMLGRVVPLRGGSGELEGWLGAAIDIHERKRAEAVQRFLAEASAALARSLDERETLEQATNLVVPELADWCVVDLNTPGGLERVAVFHPDPSMASHAEVIRRHRPRPGASSPVLEVFRTGQAKRVARYDDAAYQASVSSDEHLAGWKEGDGQSSRSRTRALASPRETCRTCSSGSTGERTWWGAFQALAWGCSALGSSWSSMAATSR